MWKASPMARGLPMRPTKPCAKSSACVSVHSDVPSPGTTTSAPLAILSITVQSPGIGGCAASYVCGPHDRHRKPIGDVGAHQLVLRGDLLAGIADVRILSKVRLDDRPLKSGLSIERSRADVNVLMGSAPQHGHRRGRVLGVLGQELDNRAEFEITDRLNYRSLSRDVGLELNNRFGKRP